VTQGRSTTPRDEDLAGRVDDVPDHLRESIEQVRTHAADLRNALAGGEAPEAAHPSPDAVPVPGRLVDELDEGIARVRAEIAQLRDGFATEGRNGHGPEAPVRTERDQACMIALNMALNGASPAETDRYLQESFCLNDRERVVADAYERVRRLGGGTPTPYDWEQG
jgi:hypothetical protein